MTDSIVDVIERLNSLREIQKQEPPFESRFVASFELAQKEAAREVEPLLKKLAEAIKAISVPIFVDGKNAQELVDRALKETKGASVDLAGLYDNIIDEVRQSIGRSREFGVGQFVIVMRNTRALAEKSGLLSIANVSFGEPVIVQDDAHLRRLVVEYVDKIAGSELAVNYVHKAAATQAAESVTGKISVFPVFIVNAAEELKTVLGNKLYKARPVHYSAPSELVEGSASEMLKDIKKNLKGK
jgi:hypothetical protein